MKSKQSVEGRHIVRHVELSLDRQLCFPLYAASKAVTRAYKPFLDEIGLTYTQYITMMALWEHGTMTLHELGEILYLDSGTLTPLLKKLEAKGLVTRERDPEDERRLVVSLTPRGDALEDEAAKVPHEMARTLSLEEGDARELYRILHEMLGDHKELGGPSSCLS